RKCRTGPDKRGKSTKEPTCRARHRPSPARVYPIPRGRGCRWAVHNNFQPPTQAKSGELSVIVLRRPYDLELVGIRQWLGVAARSEAVRRRLASFLDVVIDQRAGPAVDDLNQIRSALHDFLPCEATLTRRPHARSRSDKRRP